MTEAYATIFGQQPSRTQSDLEWSNLGLSTCKAALPKVWLNLDPVLAAGRSTSS